ncbi:MAG: efflux RND transporter periplasmic adaptor subunit [Gammaproteobacteria bacterium]|nr:efflux RND transporter periplasmic adaptor subunit [Gammaproteobacteria bacterium]MYL12627.1 efflux RND transporter periplasmic adaptor subunit [Gammaproteobacteria bacterium]
MSLMPNNNGKDSAKQAVLANKLHNLGFGTSNNRSRYHNGKLFLGLFLILSVATLAIAIYFFSIPRVVTVRSENFGTQQLAATSNSLEVVGNVIASDVATVSANEVGRVLEVLVEVGDMVVKGQPVAYLDDRQAKTHLRLNQAELELQMALQKAKKEELTLGRSGVERRQKLLEDDLVSIATYEEYESRVAVLEAELSASEHRIRMLKQQIALREQILDDLTIRAPFGGIVTHVAANVGEIISPISSGGTFTRTGICTIMDMSMPEFHFEISERFLPLVSKDSQLIVTLPSVAGLEIPAKVRQIDPSIDAQTGTVNIIAEPTAKFDELLRPGSRATGLFSTENTETPVRQDILLPESAVYQAEGTNFIYIVRENKAARLPVQVELAESGWMRVTDPWAGSYQVIVWSQSALEEGVLIRTE